MFISLTEAQFTQIREVNPQIDLPAEFPDHFEPECILFREIVSKNMGFGGEYSIIDRRRPLVGQHYSGVEDFAKKIADDKYSTLDPVDPAPRQVMELDILVDRHCFIVLRLSPTEGGWTFAGTSSHAAVTMSATSGGNPALYGGLTYVTPNSVTRSRKAGCTVVFFAAMPSYGTVAAPYIQKFNYLIRDVSGYNNTMDPDVRHPGVPEP